MNENIVYNKNCIKERCPYNAYLSIKEGKFLSGVIDKNTFGVEAHPLVYKVAKAKLNWDINAEDFLESTKLILDSARKVSVKKEDLDDAQNFIHDIDK